MLVFALMVMLLLGHAFFAGPLCGGLLNAGAGIDAAADDVAVLCVAAVADGIPHGRCRCRQHMPGLAVNATTAAIAWYMTYMVHAGQIP